MSMKLEKPVHEFPLMEPVGENIILFHPHIPDKAMDAVSRVLGSRWLGQGPLVEEFEHRFGARFGGDAGAIAVGSGTDALHLAYILAGLEPGDEVIAPVFTCVATNIPLLYVGAKVVFADVQPGTLNIDPNDVRRRITEKTKAIVCVHYGGLPCDMAELQSIADDYGIKIIEDAAHALGATYQAKNVGQISDYTVFSFQATKHITTGDGGMLLPKDKSVVEKAKRLRWFGIDREAKHQGLWENDITEIGYKYQMTDMGAALGMAALDEFDRVLSHRQSLLMTYQQQLGGIPGISLIGTGYRDRTHAAWTCTVVVENLEGLQTKLRANGIESAQVHYRNDRYSIFGGRQDDCPNMDAIEGNYLVLPLHTRMNSNHVGRVCSVIRSGW